jgi:hypothetical protein
MKKFLWLIFSCITHFIYSQNLLTAGPMLGWVEHRSALIWCEVSPEVRVASIRYWENNNAEYFY